METLSVLLAFFQQLIQDNKQETNKVHIDSHV